jgi:cysteine desulfurase/selenocysteine lyase
MDAFDVWKVRSDFPMLSKKMHGKPLIYLDSAATSQKPQVVIDAMLRFYTEQYGTVHRAVYDLAARATDLYESVREEARAFLHAAYREEILFTRGTTDALNLVASSFGHTFLNPGDEVIISEMEHHSNIVPWQQICQQRGAVLRAIPINERGEIILEEFDKLLSDRTKIVSIAHIANATGTQNPVEEIIKRAHAKGAKVCIDGAQSAAHLHVDVQKMGADFYAFSGHKAFGPTGVGILYGKKQLLEKMVPYQCGGDMIQEVHIDHSTFQELPLKFEAGTPMIAEVIGLGAALRYIEQLGRENIAAWEGALLRHATEKLSEIKGLRILGTAAVKGPIISFAIDGVHPLDIGTLLDLRGIAVRTGHQCAQPTWRKFGVSAATRISFAPYNTIEEIDAFIGALQDTLLLCT